MINYFIMRRNKFFIIFVGVIFLIVIMSFVSCESEIIFKLKENIIFDSDELVCEIYIENFEEFESIQLFIIHESGLEIYEIELEVIENNLEWDYYDLGNLPKGNYKAILKVKDMELEENFQVIKPDKGITGRVIEGIKDDGKNYGSVLGFILSLVFLWFMILKANRLDSVKRIIKKRKIIRKIKKRIKRKKKKKYTEFKYGPHKNIRGEIEEIMRGK